MGARFETTQSIHDVWLNQPYLLQKIFVLRQVLVGVTAQVLTRLAVTLQRKANGVALMIAHHGACVSCVDHVTDGVNHLDLLRATIDQITQKNGLLTVGRCLSPTFRDIAQLLKHGIQLPGLPVNIPNDVVFHFKFPSSDNCSLLHAT